MTGIDLAKLLEKEQLDVAINHLRSYRQVVDDRLYEHYSPEELQKELAEITNSILFLESLKND